MDSNAQSNASNAPNSNPNHSSTKSQLLKRAERIRHAWCNFRFLMIATVSFSAALNIILYTTSIDLFGIDYDDLADQFDMIVEHVLPPASINNSDMTTFLPYGHLRMYIIFSDKT